MTAVPYVLIGLVLLVAVVFFWMRESAHGRTEAAYERLLAKSEEMLQKERESHQATADRYFATKNLPPVGVDMKEQYEERQEERREQKILERTNGGPIYPRRVGVTDRVRKDMENDVRRQRTEQLRKEAEEKLKQSKEKAS